MQSLTQKPVNTFIRGLVTEASELTFPENASIDELNCLLDRDGTRSRRMGLEIETDAVDSSFTITDSDRVVTGEWENVGGDSGVNYLCVQKGNRIYFYNKLNAPYSSHETSHVINLGDYEHSAALVASSYDCQFTSIKGSLVIASPAINTILVTRDNITEVLTISEITFRIRDFKWIGDRTTYSEPGPNSVEREYDAQNCGWKGDKGAAAYNTYQSTRGEDPALTHYWYSGKNASGDFAVGTFRKIYGGTTLAGNGSHILDFYEQDRAAASGLAVQAYNSPEVTRFSTVASFGSRVFYAGLQSTENTGTVYFSQVVEDLEDIGELLQRNDPTAEEISDLLDTDGGVIPITGCAGIKKLYNIGDSLYVFADTGVWAIVGVDGVFSATEYSIQKISEVGILSAQSFVDAEGTPIWWSNQGIHTLTFDQVSGRGREESISLSTIQTYYDEIPASSKLKVRAGYGRINQRVYWAWPDANEVSESKLSNFLVLDLALQAFYPWKVSDSPTSSNDIVGFTFYEAYGADLTTIDVITSAGDDVVTSAGDDVTIEGVQLFETGAPELICLTRKLTNDAMVMATFTSTSYYDWGDGDYTSFAETGYDFSGDLSRSKNAPFLNVFMRVTETGWTTTDSGVSYNPVNEGSLLVSAFWDFKKASTTKPQQAYRLKFPVVPDPDNLDTFDYPTTVIDTRLKVRGSGKSMRLKFESESGKPFTLLGYNVVKGVNRNV